MIRQFRKQISSASRPVWIGIFILVYIFYLLVTVYGTTFIMKWLDGHYPGLLFYHLDPDEAPGLLGDLDEILLSISLDYACFILIFVPMAIFIQVPIWATLALALLNEPGILTVGIFFILAAHISS